MSSYTDAALRGCGRPSLTGYVQKGSPEAKARMAYLRSLRGKKTRGKGVPGRGAGINQLYNLYRPAPNPMANPEFAKKYLARKKALKGGSPIGDVAATTAATAASSSLPLGGIASVYSSFVKKWLNGWKNEHDEYKREKARLEAIKAQRTKGKGIRGGQFETQDLVDGLAGPLGWIKMGLRKKRRKEIAQMKKELGVE